MEHEVLDLSGAGLVPAGERIRFGATLAKILGLREADHELAKSHQELLDVDVDALRERLVSVLHEHHELLGHPPSVARTAEFTESITTHFKAILEAGIDPERVSQVLTLGEYHCQLRISETWISVAYALFMEHLDTRLAEIDLGDSERKRLHHVLSRLLWWYRDLQLMTYDSRWQLQDFIAAQRDIVQLICRGAAIDELFTAVCRIVVERIGLTLAWIGRVGDAGEPVEILAVAGEATGYITAWQAGIDADPFARCALSGRCIVIPDLRTDKGFVPGQEQALRFGLHAAAAFPLKEGGQTNAVMAVYSSKPGHFTLEAVALLADVAHDISHTLAERKRQRAFDRIRNFYGALSGVNQLIAHTPDRDDLFRQTVQIIAASAGVGLACVLDLSRATLPEAVLHSAGPDGANTHAVLRALEQHLQPGLAARIHQDRQGVVVNGIVEQIPTPEGRRALREHGVGAVAALPIVDLHGVVTHLLVLTASPPDFFTPDAFHLLTELARDVAFSLADLERRERLLRLQGYYAALGEVGALVSSNPATEELLQRACELVVRHTGSSGTYIATIDDAAQSVRMVGVAGPASGFVKSLEMALREDRPGGNGMVGRVYRRDDKLVVNDLIHDDRFQHLSTALARWNLRAAAGIPLHVNGACRGVLVVGASRSGHYTDELVELIERIAEAIGATMARAAEHILSLRYQAFYTALSNINELIARDPDPELLYQEACRVLAHVDSGLAVYVALVQPESECLRIVASAGAGIDAQRAAEFRSMVLSTRADESTGQGIAGYTFRSEHTLLWPHVPTTTDSPFRTALRTTMGSCSLLGVPVFCDGSCVAVLVLSAREPDFFRPDLVALSERLGANVGFALQAHRQREALQVQALTDPLTGLPNRTLYSDRLRMATSRVDREGGQVAVALIDLDRFKEVNDQFGHHIGDEVIKKLVARIAASLRHDDTLARLGGDELVAVLHLDGATAPISDILDRIVGAITPPLQISKEPLSMTASIGVAIYPRDAREPEELLRRADLAMYRVKTQGGAGWSLYEHALEERLLRRNMIRNQLAGALERQEFEVHYQPFVELATGTVTGMEALIRWRSSELGLVSPAEFMPLAEETGLIVPIGEWVLREACSRLRRLHAAGYSKLRVMVNLSTYQFCQPDLAERVITILREVGLDGRWLELEITETTVMEQVEDAVAALEELHALGVTIALDDFGTGYSSLNYLKNFRINVLKVDKSFVTGVPHDAGSSAITRTVIAMARGLGIGVIAEGIETADQLAALQEWGCEEGQGYLFSLPLAAEDFEWLLGAHPTLPVK